MDKVKYHSLDRRTQLLASVLSCITSDADHAADCRREVAGRRDGVRCQLCLDLATADELLAEIDFDEGGGT